MSFQSSMEAISFETFLESAEENLRRGALSVISMQERTTPAAEAAQSDADASSDAEEQDSSFDFDDFSCDADASSDAEEQDIGFDDFTFDDDDAGADELPKAKASEPEPDCLSEQELINSLNAFMGKTADLWLAETPNELLFAISLLHESPRDNFLPRIEDNDAAVAFLFYPGDVSAPPMVVVLDEGRQPRLRACINHSWEEEIYSRKREKKILLLPSQNLREGRLVLICRFRSDITSIDEKQLNVFQSYLDFSAGRQVLFVSSDPSAILSLKENKWWDHFAENGRFHIVLCNIRNTSAGEFDSRSPIEGALRNFKKQEEFFYPGAWRHAIL